MVNKRPKKNLGMKEKEKNSCRRLGAITDEDKSRYWSELGPKNLQF